MIKLRVFGSSSRGNCYIIENEKSILVLEAGLPFKMVKPVIDFKISKIIGVLVSHEHGDHSKHIDDYLSYSIPVYTTPETAGIHTHKRITGVQPREVFKIGEWKVMAFELKHDARCYGFLIYHPETGRILFATDTYYVPYKFKGLNHILIEANYSKKILNENIQNRVTHPVHARRVLSSHMEIETTKEMLRANDLSQVVNIVLLHLSDDNSNARNFKQEIESVTGRPVFVADKGLEINLNRGGF
jgi:phosphoribosyl 1,2-cyclic phosphodiesterase